MAIINGTPDDDTVSGTANTDFINGLAGDDVLAGLGGRSLVGSTIYGDILDGGDGIDTATYALSPAAVTVNLSFAGLAENSGGDADYDTLIDIENLVGSDFGDTLVGEEGSNRIEGGGGDDSIAGAAGADTVIGGEGIDTAGYGGSAAAVTVDLGTGQGTGGDAQGDTLAGIENLTGSAFADHLYGAAGVNLLLGGAGDDTLRGGAGADALDGGAGSDFANYQGSGAAVTVDLLNHTATGGAAVQ
ncbi:calcium-binding protein, partial [Inquilinus sp. CA228]|uniref:calcium-binding protein n=1 Tax=Inquilinus sp. CA228 TaxID=3455609 RepID=UPI003F8D5F63